MKNSPPVFVLILNYCSYDDTIKCLETIRKSDYLNFKVLVIDNNSPDKSKSELKKHIPEKEFIQLSRNTGYAGGNNFGIRIALEQNSRYILILNPDVRLPKNAISNYVKIMQENPSISALNSIQLTENGNSIDKIFEHEMFNRNNHIKPSFPIPPSQLWEVNTLFGAALFLDREIIEKAGAFDPIYFAYWEEIDLCRRIKIHGGKLFVTSDSPVLHLRSYNKQEHCPFRAYLRLKGMYLYRLKDTKRSYSKLVPEILKELLKNSFSPSDNDFGWHRKEYLKTLFWVSAHLPQIYLHRQKDLTGAAYL